MRYLGVTKARRELPDLITSIERTVITRYGQPAAILLHIDDYRAMRAMQVLISDPQRLRQVLEDHDKVQRGELDEFVEFPIPES